MKEDFGSILKEFEGLTPNERIKNMAKQQEEFLKGIDSGKLVERPEIAHKLLELEGALVCKKEKIDDISVRCIAIGSKTENKAIFYPLGSEQQKRVFPEIVI